MGNINSVTGMAIQPALVGARAVLAAASSSFIPEIPGLDWTASDEAQANLEGWCISNSPEGSMEIQKLDDQTAFALDTHAVAHVYWKAGTGSALHRKALAYTLQPGNEWSHPSTTTATATATADTVPDNTQRAGRVPALIRAYEGILGEVPEGTDPAYLSSMMADMRHWCEQNGHDFADLLALSAEHFTDELNGG